MPLPMFKKNERKPLSEVKNIIAIAAGKGGVGKSSVAVNLGLTLQYLGYQVGILDTDIYGPSIRKMLPENQPPKQQENMLHPALCNGIKMISMAYFRHADEAAVVRAPIANGIITQFIQNVEWGPLDFLLIDFPPGTGDIQLTLSQQANLTGAIMVTTPQEVAVMDVRKAMHMFDQVKIPIIGIVENMSYFTIGKTSEKIAIFGTGGGGKLAMEAGLPLLGEIPIDPEICRCGDMGQPFINKECNKENPSIKAFLNIAQNAIDEIKSLATREKAIRINHIRQMDNHSVQIEWNNGKKGIYRFHEIQKHCPCANCVDEITGQRRVPASVISPDVGAVSIQNMGRYALKIKFTSGCSAGIYDFDLLYAMASS